MWENGKQHGEGLFTTSTNQIRKGIWVDGVRTQWVEAAFVVSPMHSVEEKGGLFGAIGDMI